MAMAGDISTATNRVNGTIFTVTSGDATDASMVGYLPIEPSA